MTYLSPSFSRIFGLGAALLLAAAPAAQESSTVPMGEGVSAFVGNLEHLVLAANALTSDQIDAAYRSFYTRQTPPDWAQMTPAQFRDYLNQQGFPQLAASAQQYHLNMVPLGQVSEAAAQTALESLKRGQYSAAWSTLLASAGVSLADLGKWSEALRTMQLVAQLSTFSPVAPAAQLMHHTLRHTVMTRATTEAQAELARAENRRGGFFSLQPTLGLDGFYGATSLADYDQDIATYGAHLAFSAGDRFQVSATVPLYQLSAGDYHQTTYGGEIALKYSIVDALAVGAHGSYLARTGDAGDDSQWAGGPFAGYSYRLSEDYLLSVGVLADYLRPNWGQGRWVIAGGVNLGMNIRDDIALNPYYLYFRDLEAPAGLDEDWHDLGVEFLISFGRRGMATLGAKTTLGYDPFDTNWQVYGGLSWKF